MRPPLLNIISFKPQSAHQVLRLCSFIRTRPVFEPLSLDFDDQRRIHLATPSTPTIFWAYYFVHTVSILMINHLRRQPQC